MFFFFTYHDNIMTWLKKHLSWDLNPKHGGTFVVNINLKTFYKLLQIKLKFVHEDMLFTIVFLIDLLAVLGHHRYLSNDAK